MDRPQYRRPFVLAWSLLLLAAGLSAAQPATQPATTQPETPPATQPAVAVETQPVAPARQEMVMAIVQERLAAARTELGAIPSDAGRDTPDGLRRAALQRRVALLEEYLALVANAESLGARRLRSEVRLAAVRQDLATLNAQTAPATAPTVATKEGFESLRTTVTTMRDRLAGQRTAIADRRNRQAEIPRLIAEARRRAEETDKRAERVLEEGGNDPASRRLTEIRLENLRTERYVAVKQAEVLQLEADAEPFFNMLRALELELAEKQLERLEQAFALYGEALQQALARERKERQDELSRRQQEAAAAHAPADRFVAEREADIALAERNRSELGPLLVSLQTEVAEQEKRLAGEKDEFASLQEFLRVAGSSRHATERIKHTLEQIRHRQVLLKRDQWLGLAERMDEFRSRRFELDQALLTLNESWRHQREQVLAQLPEADRPAFLTTAAALMGRYRSAIREEKDLLTSTLALWQQWQLLYLERSGKQDEMERFIRATAFWLRDGKPLSMAMLPALWRETAELAAWSADLVSETMVERVLGAASTPLAALYAGLLFPILPIVLFAVRQRLRRIVKARNQETLDVGASLANRVVAITVGMLSAAIVPAYFYFASRFIAAAGLPPAVGPVASGLVEHFAYFLFLWFLSRCFFAGRSVAQVQLGVPGEAALAIHRSLRMVAMGYLVALLPWLLFRRPPFEFETMPRLGYTGFEIVAAIAIMRLIRSRSAFMRYAFAEADNHFIKRNWRLINGVITLLMVGIIALDMAGYRYGAANLAASFVKSLLTLMAVLPLYAGAKAMFATIAAQRRWTEPPTEEAILRRLSIERRISQAIRLAFILVSGWLLAGYWGIDAHALKTLDNVHLYTIRSGDTEEFLTAADAIRFALVVGATLWTLWALPGIYEFAIFPRLKLDEGLKYAILTISRYTVFGVGVMMALSATHLDIGRLGWLMAAMGVGLGFGLQEIVSNFVSGIILLVERPIQVGDIVTVGNMSGTVKRINIRATTILNFDRQEVIVPNRSLITSEVTNWTRGDTINRLVIKIGAAYGSDVDLVSKLLRDIATSQPEVLKDPPPQAVFMAHGESSLDFELRVFIPAPSLLVPLRDRINKAINREFARHNISIPFPQRDLHIKSSDLKLPGLLAAGLGKTDIPADLPEPRR